MVVALLLATLSVSLVPTPLMAEETTGEIIRELVESVHSDVAGLEARIAALSSRKSGLTAELQDLAGAYRGADDPVLRREVGAEMQVVLAQLNRTDRETVAAIQGAVTDLRPSLKMLQEEFSRASLMGHESAKDFEVWRESMGHMLSSAEKMLTSLRDGPMRDTIGSDLYSVEETILLMYEALGQTTTLERNSTDVLADQISSLDDAYAQLTNLGVLLDQERLTLKLMTYGQIVDAVRGYLSGGAFACVTGASAQVLQSMGERNDAISLLMEPTAESDEPRARRSRIARREALLAELREGRFSWHAAEVAEGGTR